MKRLMIIVMTLFSLTLSQTSFAGVAGFDGGTYKGVFNGVNCKDGLECTKDGQRLLLKTNAVKTPIVFTSGDTTPSVANGSFFYTNATPVIITTFDDGYIGQEITIVAAGAASLDVTGTALKCGTTDVVLASDDVTKFVKVNANWYCTTRIDASDNVN